MWLDVACPCTASVRELISRCSVPARPQCGPTRTNNRTHPALVLQLSGTKSVGKLLKEPYDRLTSTAEELGVEIDVHPVA